MRSLFSESSVGLLLFDEPSASLDPSAEHGIQFQPDLLPFLNDALGHRSIREASPTEREQNYDLFFASFWESYTSRGYNLVCTCIVLFFVELTGPEDS
jgi:hypothetical protein